MSSLITRLRRTEDPALRHALLRGRGFMHGAARGHVVRSRAVRRYLDDTDEPRLQIGAGPQKIDGWLNSDLISGEIHLDLGRTLPFGDRTFTYVFGEHVIEHIPERIVGPLLAEIRRILRPGGVLRLTTPDLKKIIALYEDRNPVIARAEYARFLDEQTGKPHERPCQILNDYMRLWGHQWIFDEEDLSARLTEAGLLGVKRFETGESDHELLRGLERHGGADWVNSAEAMCLEATRG